MNEWIASKLMGVLLVKNGSVTEIKIGFYIKTLLSEIEKMLLLVFLYALLGFLVDIMVILTVMLMLRPYIGGTHKSTFNGCFFKTVIFGAVGILLARCVRMGAISQVIATVILVYHMLKAGPIISKYRPKYEGELLKRIKIRGLLMLLILNCMYIFLNGLYRNQVTVIMYMLIIDVIIARKDQVIE